MSKSSEYKMCKASLLRSGSIIQAAAFGIGFRQAEALAREAER